MKAIAPKAYSFSREHMAIASRFSGFLDETEPG
jgi:hypothetical protein